MAHDDWQKRRPWGDTRVDPNALAPDDEEQAAGPDGYSRGVIMRALSVIPLLLVAAFGLIGVVTWAVVILFGAGSTQPIWKAVRGLSFAALIWQLVLVVLIGLVPLLITLGASWATVRGFGEESSRVFWTVIQALWGLAAVGLVVARQTRHAWLADFGLSTIDWWFMFGVVAFAMILAGVRLRRAPRPHPR